MKFHIGPPLEKLGFPPDDSWHRLPGCGAVKLQLLATPLALLAGWLTGLAWNYGTTATDSGELWWNIPLSTCLWFIFAGIPLHELLHAVTLPKFGLTADSYLCVWPSKLLPYVQYLAPLSRRRRFVLLLMPFLVVTVLPLCVALMLHRNQSPFVLNHFNHCTATLAVYSVMNAMLSGGDLLMTWSSWRLIPAQARVQGSGWTLYWKIP